MKKKILSSTLTLALLASLCAGSAVKVLAETTEGGSLEETSTTETVTTEEPNNETTDESSDSTNTGDENSTTEDTNNTTEETKTGGKITIRYIDAQSGIPLTTTEISSGTYSEGENVSIEKLELEGYHIIESSYTSTIVCTKEDQTIEVKYNKVEVLPNSSSSTSSSSSSTSTSTSTSTSSSTTSSSSSSTSSSSDEDEYVSGEVVVQEISIEQGQKWDPSLHLKSLTLANESYSFAEAVEYGALTYTPKELDTSKVGEYEITITVDANLLPYPKEKKSALSNLNPFKSEVAYAAESNVVSVSTKLFVVAATQKDPEQKKPTPVTPVQTGATKSAALLPQTGEKHNSSFAYIGAVIMAGLGFAVVNRKRLFSKQK